MNKLRGDVGSCGGVATLTLGRIRGLCPTATAHECPARESESRFPDSRECSDDKAAPMIS
jgi:hypothetical protein